MSIPALHFKAEFPFLALQRLEKIYVAPSIEFIYSAKYKYVRRPARENILEIEDSFMKVPSSREPALQLIGIMLHESINMTFLKFEKAFDQNAVELEIELCKFFERLLAILTRFNSRKLRFTVLKWILALCADIAKYNQKRAKVRLAREVIPYFMKFRCINSLINLLISLLQMLIPEHIETVVAITTDCFKYGVDFDWILLHIVTNFSFDFIPPLLNIIINEMGSRLEHITQAQELKKSQNYIVIADLMCFLSIKKNAKLRTTLFENISGFFNGAKPIRSLFCVINLCIVYPEVSQMMGEDLEQLLNTRNMIVLLKLVFSPHWKGALLHPLTMKYLNVQASTVKFLRAMPLNTLIVAYDKLISLTSNPQSLNEQLKFDQNSFLEMCSKVEQFMNDLFTTILMKTLSEKNVTFSTLPYLEELVQNEKRLGELCTDVLVSQTRSNFNSKLLNICCLIGQRQFTIKVLSQMLYDASSEGQLIKFVAFLRTLKTHFAHIGTDTVVYLIQNLNDFDTQYRSLHSTVFVNLTFMTNLANISDWQTKELTENGLESAHNIVFSTIDGHLQLMLLDFLYGIVERLYLTKSMIESKLINIVNDWLSNMTRLSVVEFNRLEFGLMIRLITKLAGIGVLLIRFLPETTNDEAQVVGMCKSYFDFCNDFFSKGLQENQHLQLLRWCMNKFITHFLTNVFDMSHDLFGTKPDLFESLEQMAFDDIPDRLLPAISHSSYILNTDKSCLELLRLKPFVQRRTAALAHSGTISKQHSKFKQVQWTSVEKLRCSIIVGFCSNFCDYLKRRIPDFETQVWCLIGKVLVRLSCPDALSSTIAWLDWNIERECVPLYTEVTNKIRDLPLIYDLLLQLSQTGFSTICSVLPLIKSMFAVVTNMHGSTPRKFDTLNTAQLEDIARIFSLFLSSGLLPMHFKPLFELFKRTTHHETYLILVSLWEYIRLRVPQSIDELQALCNSEIPPTEFTRKADPRILTAIVTAVIQLHIEDLGHLLPSLLTEEDEENVENEIW